MINDQSKSHEINSKGWERSVGTELKTYLRVMVRHKRVIATCAVIALGLTTILSFFVTPLYAATAKLRVASAPGAEAEDAWTINNLATRMMNTYVEIAMSDPVLTELAEQLDHDTLPTIEAKVVPETELIEITAWHPDATIASSAANILASMLVGRSLELYSGDAPTSREILEDQVEQAKADLNAAMAAYEEALNTQVSEGEVEATIIPVTGGEVETPGTPFPEGESKSPSVPVSEGELQTLSREVGLRQDIYVELLGRYENARVRETLRGNAISIMQLSTPPTKPSKPNIPINALLGLMGGLTGGIFIAFFMESLDTSLRTIEDVEDLTSLPVLARVPEIPKIQMIRIKSQDLRKNGHFPSLGLYQPLVMRLLAYQASSPVRSILVTSPELNTGKSIVTVQLGLNLTQSGNRVILVDANLRRPNLQRHFRLPNDPGLSTVLRGKMIFNSETPSYQITRKLRVLTAGQPSNNPSALFTKASVEDLFQRLSDGVDTIVIDSPAMLSVSEASMLATQVDLVVLVVALGHTEPEYLHQSIRQLNDMGTRVIGVVVNRIPSSRLLNY